MTTKRDNLLAVLQGHVPEVIPHADYFMDTNAQAKHMPELSGLPQREVVARIAERLDSSVAGVTISEPYRTVEVIVDNGLERITRDELGAVHVVRKNPYFRKVLQYPIRRDEDLKTIALPSFSDPRLYEGIADDVRFYIEQGLFVEGKVPGVFTGVWYTFRPLTEFLCDMAGNPRFAGRLVELAGSISLIQAENLLKLGVDCIVIPEDMGATHHPWFSRATYETLFFPWHKALAQLCHRYRRHFRIHSHGYIMPFVDLVVDTGADMLHPVGPGDSMDLALMKREFGRRITLRGGISMRIDEMSREELAAHVDDVIRIGADGGRFIAGCESGVPERMSADTLDFYLCQLRDCREKHARPLVAA